MMTCKRCGRELTGAGRPEHNHSEWVRSVRLHFELTGGYGDACSRCYEPGPREVDDYHVVSCPGGGQKLLRKGTEGT